MLGKIKIKLCRHHYSLNIPAPNPEYYYSYTTKLGTTVFYCKKCSDLTEERIELFKKQLKEKNKRFEKLAEENLEDSYIIKILGQGLKNKYLYKFPKDLIELKRAEIKLIRLIKEKRKPIMHCIYHGDLYQKDVIKCGKNPAGIQRFKCRACHKICRDNYYKNNKELVNEKNKRYKSYHPEKMKEIRQKYYRKMKYGSTENNE